ncbi:MAG: hypothetical protein PHS56_10115, partial [Eubacteriales bacterium]|nr:hypothetical protein [Eubacteriales bacterium]
PGTEPLGPSGAHKTKGGLIPDMQFSGLFFMAKSVQTQLTVDRGVRFEIQIFTEVPNYFIIIRSAAHSSCSVIRGNGGGTGGKPH